MSAAPDLSLILAVYNGEKNLLALLEGLIWPEHFSMELICVNDGSTDGTLALLEAFKATHPDKEIKILDKANGGYGSAMNAGLKSAQGRYIGFLEADDRVEGAFYEELLNLAHRFEDPEVVKAAYTRLVDTGSGQKRFKAHFVGRGIPQNRCFKLEEAPQLIEYHPSIWSALYRRDFLLQHNIHFVEAKGGGWVDNPFLIDTLARAERICFTEHSGYVYSEEAPGSSSIVRNNVVAFKRWLERAEILERLGCTVEAIVRSNNRVAYKYIAAALDELDSKANKELNALYKQILEKLDLRLLDEDSSVAPGLKLRIYADMLDYLELKDELEASLLSAARGQQKLGPKLKYLANIFRELVWALKVQGFSYLSYLAKR